LLPKNLQKKQQFGLRTTAKCENFLSNSSDPQLLDSCIRVVENEMGFLLGKELDCGKKHLAVENSVSI
jgi:hypothetical protein